MCAIRRLPSGLVGNLPVKSHKGGARLRGAARTELRFCDVHSLSTIGQLPGKGLGGEGGLEFSLAGCGGSVRRKLGGRGNCAGLRTLRIMDLLATCNTAYK